MSARKTNVNLQNFMILLLFCILAFPIITAQTSTPTLSEVLIEAVKAKAREDVDLGKDPVGVEELNLLFGEEARALDISLREIEIIYVQEYKDFQPKPNPWAQIPTLPAVAVMLLLAIITLILSGVATKIFEVISSPVKYLGKKIYQWIAPRNPLNISIKVYRRHVLRSTLARIMNPVGPESIEIPLETAFAPLKLISSEMNEGIDLFDYASENPTFVLLGGPGTGKTTLMKSLLINVLKDSASEDLNELIPIFVRLRNLSAKKHTVQKAINAAFDEHFFPGSERFVESSFKEGKLLVILDGLDEVGVNREFVLNEIREFSFRNEQLQPKNRIVVTCRENSYRHRDLRDYIPKVVRIELFSAHHMQRFLSGWPPYKGKNALGLYTLLQSDSQILDICRTPLLLTILTGLYMEKDDFQIPSSRVNFYKETIEELMINRPKRKGIVQKFEYQNKRRLLEIVSLDSITKSGTTDDLEEITFEQVKKNIQSIMNPKN